jgi:hypothetical protein
MVCPHCQADAAFEGYRGKTFLTPNGDVRARRAYYHCENCQTGHFPFDAANDLRGDHLSTGLRPLVCLAGVLESFRIGAADILRRFSRVNVSAATARRATQQAGARLAEQQRRGDIAAAGKWKAEDFAPQQGQGATVAYLGLDAFSVPMQGKRGAKAEGRMLYTALLYTPDKGRSHYLADFDLDCLGAQMRQAAVALGLDQAEKLIAVTDGGNGIEECIRRHFWDDLLCVLDWYHACEHLHDYAKWLAPHDEGARQGWVKEAENILYERGGKALVEHLRGQEAPADEKAADELRKLTNYFAGNEHRTNYPSYKKEGWDIGSGPVESACKVVGDRLKRSGMRWVEAGAARVSPLRALYWSGEDVWDAYWALAA